MEPTHPCFASRLIHFGPSLSFFLGLAGFGGSDIFGEVGNWEMISAMFSGPEHVEESVGCVGLLFGEGDFVLFSAVDDILRVFIGQFKKVLLVLLHFLDGLLRLVNHLVDLDKKKCTGT